MPRSFDMKKFFLLAVAILIAAWITLPFTGPVDDAYITMTYSRNLIEGNGLVFNPGENVEGSTAFGQVILLAFFCAMGIVRLDFVAVILGILAWAGALTLGFRLYLKDREAQERSAAGTLDLLIFGFLLVSPTSLVWPASAMETPIVALLWILALTLHLEEEKSNRIPWASALAVVGAGLMRPDGILVAVPLGLSWLIPFRKDRFLRGLQFGAMVLAIFGGYWLWRWHHFGYFTPNTYMAKVGAPSRALVARGLFYLFMACVAWIFPPLFTVALLRNRRLWPNLPRWFWIAAGLAVISGIYAVGVGGDFFPYHRFLVPGLIPGAVSALALFRRLIDKKRTDKGLAAQRRASLIRAAVLLGLWWIWAVGSPVVDIYKARWLVRWTKDWVSVGTQLEKMTPKDSLIATLPIGAIGYFSHRRILDMVGLTDLHIGRAKLRTGANIVGHEKFDSQYVLDRAPELILTWPVLWDGYPESVKDWQYAHTIAWAQRDIYLVPRTFELYTPMSANLRGGILIGLLRSDLIRNPAWAEFKPLPSKLREKYFDPALFRKVQKPTWKEAFDEVEKKKNSGGVNWK